MIFVVIVIPLLIPKTVSGTTPPSYSEFPKVTISLLQPIQTAQVGPRESHEVVFNGTVSVALNSATSVLVYINAEDTWGSAEFNPTIFLFTQNGEKSFIVRVNPRPRESTQNFGTLRVFGRWEVPEKDLSGYAEPSEGAIGRINIAQFCKFTLTITHPFVELESGDSYLFTLNIHNMGNGQDIFGINVRNLKELNDKGFKIYLSHSLVVIEEKPTELPIQILVETPSGIYFKNYYSIEIEVNSETGMELGASPQTFTFVIRIPGLESPIFECIIGTIIMFVIIIVILLVKSIGRNSKKKLKNLD